MTTDCIKVLKVISYPTWFLAWAYWYTATLNDNIKCRDILFESLYGSTIIALFYCFFDPYLKSLSQIYS